MVLLAISGHPADARAQSWRTITSTRQIVDTGPLAVDVEYAAGKLEVEPADGNVLYRMELRLDDERFLPVAEYDREAAELHLGIESRERRNIDIDDTDESQMHLELSPQVPMALAVRFGAGEANLELGGLSLRSAEFTTGGSKTHIEFSEPNRIAASLVQIKAGAAELEVRGLANARAERIEFTGGVGETVLDFGGQWTGNTSAEVKIGVGAVTLRLPREVGVHIQQSSFLADFNAAGLVKRGGAFYSRNWEGAAQRLSLRVEAALGSVDIEWID